MKEKLVAITDNTNVKIPFRSRLTEAQSAEGYLPTLNNSYRTDVSYLQPAQKDDEGDFPSDMFIAQLLKINDSCQVKLEQIRQMLFCFARECDGFPYRLQDELKKRVSTRKSESLCMKLAYDIHVILSVLEGEDMGPHKNLLSTSRTGRY